MKQLHDLNGKIVLIDWVGYYDYITQDYSEAKKEDLKTAIPTLEQDRSAWLELSERCGGKLEEGKDFKMCIDWDSLDAVKHIPAVLYAIPTPQTEDLWEEAYEYLKTRPEILDMNLNVSVAVKILSSKYRLTRKS